MARKSTKKNDSELKLEQVLWNCRVALRGVGSMEKNRDAVISLVFLKFAGDKFNNRRKELVEQYGDIPAFLEKPSFYNAVNVFYLPEPARWTYLVDHAGDNAIATIIDNAMSEAEKANPSLKGALPLGLFATLGATKSSIKSLIDEIAELIEPYEGVVYDPCCGSGGMFVQSYKFVERHHGNSSAISVVGQESNPDTWRLCKMNLAIRGISNNLGEEAISTFEKDQHKDKKVDYIMANPPFNLKKWRDDDGLLNDPRWKGYPTPPVSNANYAWILHMLSKLDVNHGVAGFLLANGALNADGDEGAIRQKILENDKVEAIIVLPRDMFYTTDISVTLWILNMNKGPGEKAGRKLRDRRGEVLFVDLRTWDENIEKYTYEKSKSKKKTVLTSEQIARVKDIFESWRCVDGGYEDVPELCKSVHIKGDDSDEITIESHGFALTPSKYIEFIDHDLGIDYEKEMGRIQSEMKELLAIEKKSQVMLEGAFEGIGYGIE